MPIKSNQAFTQHFTQQYSWTWAAKVVLAICLYILTLNDAYADASKQRDELVCNIQGRPCIALVLGGGGARGSAHIGVLKAIEEIGLPIDLIVGTSIGSLVGGLYASGKTPSEIETSFRTADWNSGYRDALNRGDIPIRRKQQLDDMPIHLDLGVDTKGLHLPRGVIQGQSMKRLMDEMLGSYSRFSSFDELLIPYRAVAADAETGEQVILNKGDLASAMQMSMSLPGIVRPMRYEGRLLVDGGVANNLPISVARDLGADIIIAVDIGSPTLKEDQLNSGFAILRQLTGFLTHHNVDNQKGLLGKQDILLTPDIQDVGLLSFDKTLEAVKAGYNEAIIKLDKSTQIETLIHTENRMRPTNPTHPKIKILNKIKIVNNTRLSNDFILYRMNLSIGKSYSIEDLQQAVNRLYGHGTIARIRTFWDLNAGLNILNIEVDEKEWGPNYTDFKLSMEDDFGSFSRYQLGLSYLRSNISPLGGEWYNEIEIGSSKRLFSEIYWPLFSPAWSTVGSLEYQRNISDIRENGINFGSSKETKSEYQLGFGWANSDHMQITATGIYTYTEIAVPLGYKQRFQDIGLLADTFEIEQNGARLRFRFDSLDNASFPRHGVKFNLDFTYSTNTLDGQVDLIDDQGEVILDNFDLHYKDYNSQYDAELNSVGSIGRHSFRGLLRYQGHFEDQPSPLFGEFELGGFLNLSGTSKDFVSGSHLRFASMVYTYELASNNFGTLNLPLYLGMSIEAGNAWQYKDLVDYGDLIYAGSIFIGWNSPLGPMYLANGRSDTGDSSFYFYLGKVF